MECPVCKQKNIVVQNGYNYCLTCKRYISKVGSNFKLRVSNSEFKEDLHQPIIEPITTRFPVLKHFKFLLIPLVLFIAYFLIRDFFYLDLENKCFIRIGFSWQELSNTQIKKAINVLKLASPENYSDLCKRVDVINPNLSCGGFEGGCFYPSRPRTIDVSTTTRQLAQAAEVIAHEVCHAKQFYEGRPGSEPECYATGSAVLKRIVDY